MTESRAVELASDARDGALVELGKADSDLLLFDAESPRTAATPPFGRAFPKRFARVGAMPLAMFSIAAGAAAGGRTVFATTSARLAAGLAYPIIREAICHERSNVKIVATRSEAAGTAETLPPMIEDVGVMRGLPAMTVVVPADAPATRSALRAVARQDGPAYVRLSAGPLPVVTDGEFRIGRAAELAAGDDLTIVAVGPPVAMALDAAADLARVGISVRVLDFASIKPFDAPALLRAARDTGAILVLEEHSVLTGVGALVAATTSENYPVPVRRVGIPDLFGDPFATGAGPARRILSREQVRGEAWELLRGRGKVQ